MTSLPQLGNVPNISKDFLTLKATISGITLLKQKAFRSRYTGNKYSAVDINGNMWVKKSELMKVIKNGNDKLTGRAKKKGAVKTTPGEIIPNDETQSSENLSTQTNGLFTNSTDLSTFKEVQYRINKKEVRQRILGYINTTRGAKELYFWTVTFPAGVFSDGAIYRIFNIWLTSLRQYKMLREYVWIAERQPDTGTIHFHIAIPHKMPVQKANNLMRSTLCNEVKRGRLGYDIYKARRYNGVDIAKNRNTRRVINFAVKKGSRALVTYLTKYITKNDAGFSHLAWHNSRGFSSIFTGITFSIPEFVQMEFHFLLDRAKRFDSEFFTFVPWRDDLGPPVKITEHLFKINSYLQEQLN